MHQAKWKGKKLRWTAVEDYWLCQRMRHGNVFGPIGVGKTKDEAFANWQSASLAP